MTTQTSEATTCKAGSLHPEVQHHIDEFFQDLDAESAEEYLWESFYYAQNSELMDCSCANKRADMAFTLRSVIVLLRKIEPFAQPKY